MMCVKLAYNPFNVFKTDSRSISKEVNTLSDRICSSNVGILSLFCVFKILLSHFLIALLELQEKTGNSLEDNATFIPLNIVKYDIFRHKTKFYKFGFTPL